LQGTTISVGPGATLSSIARQIPDTIKDTPCGCAKDRDPLTYSFIPPDRPKYGSNYVIYLGRKDIRTIYTIVLDRSPSNRRELQVDSAAGVIRFSEAPPETTLTYDSEISPFTYDRGKRAAVSNADVLVANGGTLTLGSPEDRTKGETLVMASRREGQLELVVWKGGSLLVHDSQITSGTGEAYWLRIGGTHFRNGKQHYEGGVGTGRFWNTAIEYAKLDLLLPRKVELDHCRLSKLPGVRGVAFAPPKYGVVMRDTTVDASGQKYALRFHDPPSGKGYEIRGCKFSNSAVADVSFHYGNNANIALVSTEYSTGGAGARNAITRKWYLEVSIVDEDGDPVPSIEVWADCSGGEEYDDRTTTGAGGKCQLKVTQYMENREGTHAYANEIKVNDGAGYVTVIAGLSVARDESYRLTRTRTNPSAYRSARLPAEGEVATEEEL